MSPSLAILWIKTIKGNSYFSEWHIKVLGKALSASGSNICERGLVKKLQSYFLQDVNIREFSHKAGA